MSMGFWRNKGRFLSPCWKYCSGEVCGEELQKMPRLDNSAQPSVDESLPNTGRADETDAEEVCETPGTANRKAETL